MKSEQALLPLVTERQVQDKVRSEGKAFERLKAELASAFAAPERTYQALTAEEVIARNLFRSI